MASRGAATSFTATRQTGVSRAYDELIIIQPAMALSAFLDRHVVSSGIPPVVKSNVQRFLVIFVIDFALAASVDFDVL